MPYVNIRITREGATAEQKAQLIKETTQLLVDVLGKNPATTVVIINRGGNGQLGHRRGERDNATEAEGLNPRRRQIP